MPFTDDYPEYPPLKERIRQDREGNRDPRKAGSVYGRDANIALLVLYVLFAYVTISSATILMTVWAGGDDEAAKGAILMTVLGAFCVIRITIILKNVDFTNPPTVHDDHKNDPKTKEERHR